MLRDGIRRCGHRRLLLLHKVPGRSAGPLVVVVSVVAGHLLRLVTGLLVLLSLRIVLLIIVTLAEHLLQRAHRVLRSSSVIAAATRSAWNTSLIELEGGQDLVEQEHELLLLC